MAKGIYPKTGEQVLLSEFIARHADFNKKFKSQEVNLFQAVRDANYDVNHQQFSSAFNSAKTKWKLTQKPPAATRPRTSTQLGKSFVDPQRVSVKHHRVGVILRTASELREKVLRMREMGTQMLSALEGIGDTDQMQWVFEVLENNAQLREQVTQLEARVKQLEGRGK